MQISSDLSTQAVINLSQYANLHRLELGDALNQVLEGLDLKLSKEERAARIIEGQARSGYVPKGKKMNQAMHEKIRMLDNSGLYTREQIASEVGCGIATVYRAVRGI